MFRTKKSCFLINKSKEFNDFLELSLRILAKLINTIDNKFTITKHNNLVKIQKQ